MDAGLAAYISKFLAKVIGKEIAKALAHGVGPSDAGEFFDLRVPAFHPVIEANGEDADVDGFDDVLAELLEAFIFVGFVAERRVKAGVFYGDGDIVGNSHQQFDVVAGEKITFGGATDAEVGQDAPTRTAGNVVREVEVGNGVTDTLGK